MSAAAALKNHGELEDLRYYLRAWRQWVRNWRAPLSLPSSVPYLHEMRPTVAGYCDDADEEEVGSHILRAIDAEVESLPPIQRAAVRLTYLNEVLPAVFRSARTSASEVMRHCAEAELAMLPKLRARGVVLGRA